MTSENGDYGDSYRSVWTYIYDVPHELAYVDAGGIRTRYLTAGPKDAPALIMLHGTAACFESCIANIRAHAEHFRVFAVDLIGNGFSDKPDELYESPVYAEHIKNFMAAVGIKKASFMGISLGSFVAFKTAELYPELVDKITAISAFGRPLPPPKEGGQTTLDALRVARAKVVADPHWDAIESALEPLIAKKEDRIDDLVYIRQTMYRLPGMEKAMANIFDVYDPTVFNRNALSDEALRSIQSPTLVIASTSNSDEFLKGAKAYAALLPHAKVAEIKGAKHWPQWEQAEEFNRINLEFLLDRALASAG